jgi:hypothetical protein
MSEPKFTGVWIPAGVFQTTTISITAKVVYGVVDGLDNDEGCFASNAYLSKHLGLGERQLRNLLKELDDAGLITRIEQEGRRIIRTVEKVALQNALAGGQVTRSEGVAKNCLGGRQEIAVGGGKKLPTYNKENNKEDKDTVRQQLWIARLPFGSEAFLNAWKSWVVYRKEMKKTLTDSSVQAQCKEFALWGEQKSIESIEQSIKQGWQGLFEPNKKFGAKNTKALTSEDHNAF